VTEARPPGVMKAREHLCFAMIGEWKEWRTSKAQNRQRFHLDSTAKKVSRGPCERRRGWRASGTLTLPAHGIFYEAVGTSCRQPGKCAAVELHCPPLLCGPHLRCGCTRTGDREIGNQNAQLLDGSPII